MFRPSRPLALFGVIACCVSRACADQVMPHADALVPTPSLRGAATEVGDRDKAGGWYYFVGGAGANPGNVQDNGNTVSVTVRPEEEVTRIVSNAYYTGGKLEVLVQSAANSPGVVTSIYLTSGGGRTSDQSPGHQDELDLEWRGMDPSTVQTNVFIQGEQSLEVVGVGGDTSTAQHVYAIQWDDKEASFTIDGRTVRTQTLQRALAPMRLELSVWTTTYGSWPGLIKWAGTMDWNARNRQPATATFTILSLPH